MLAHLQAEGLRRISFPLYFISTDLSITVLSLCSLKRRKDQTEALLRNETLRDTQPHFYALSVLGRNFISVLRPCKY